MLRISQILLPSGHTQKELKNKIARKLGLGRNEEFRYEIIRQSIDARKKPDIIFSYTIDVTVNNEQDIIKRTQSGKDIQQMEKQEYCFPYSGIGKNAGTMRPVIVGFGPAGIFCGYMLALHGFKPIIIERGDDVDQREQEVLKFWQNGILNPESNVQFGEGGAGTFSDGKLNTLIKDKDGRGRAVLTAFVKAGAPENILYDYKPHVGTDILKKVVRNMRCTIQQNGGDIRFGCKATHFLISEHKIQGLIVNGEETLMSDRIILAIGHSARDTFQVLFDSGLHMEAKAFAVGLRVEHPQSMINLSQYGREENRQLGAAPYKLTASIESEEADGVSRSVYSFCMCPGGYVVNASSEPGRCVVNGMSYSGRDGSNANSAIVVTVTPADYGNQHPLSGIAFQRALEEKAYLIGKGKVPVQVYKDFKINVMGTEDNPTENREQNTPRENVPSDFQPVIKGQWCFAPVHEILPQPLNETLIKGMEKFGKMIKGFNDDCVLLSGVESRTSSPLRIIRDGSLQSSVKGLYPCGEGAGYAGGITSAAMDGIRVAEAVAADIIKNR